VRPPGAPPPPRDPATHLLCANSMITSAAKEPLARAGVHTHILISHCRNRRNDAMSTTSDPALEQDNDDSDLYVDHPLPPESFADVVREAPLTAVITAFIAGLVVGRLIL
jgi:hypothetical protein